MKSCCLKSFSTEQDFSCLKIVSSINITALIEDFVLYSFYFEHVNNLLISL